MKTQPLTAFPRGIKPLHIGFTNSVYVGVNDILQTKYDWLKSSDRDAAMGAASVTNRRVLLLEPGVWTVTSTFILDEEFIDIRGIGAYATSIIERTTAGDVMEQTADDVRLSNFAIRHNTAAFGSDGFILNASDNSASIYTDMDFYCEDGSTGAEGWPVNTASAKDINGTWFNCTCNQLGWRVIGAGDVSGTFFYCSGGWYSWGGDQTNADMSGTFWYCKGGDGSFGGCLFYGCKLSGTFIGCEAGDRSFALGKEASGTFIDCRAGYDSFAGHTYGANYGTASGTFIRCVALGGYSFGMGHASCVQSGQFIDCRNGTAGEYAGGKSGASVSTITDNGAKASIATEFAGANNDIEFTARHTGDPELPIRIEYVPTAPGSEGTITIDRQGDVDYITIQVAIDNDGTTLALTVLGNFKNNPVAASLVSVAYTDGIGIGAIPAEGFPATALAGGVDGVYFSGNQPWGHTAAMVGTPGTRPIYPFDNGATFTNTDATAIITLALPPAIVGLKYPFRVTVAVAMRLDPDGTETIALNGTQQAAGKYITANAVGEGCDLECIVAGQWEQFNIIGTWTAEP